jgi:anhydro-N-acetylmuramic acid kinase
VSDAENQTRPRRVVGCMSGTSLDGIDAALVEISGQGLAMRARFIRGVSCGLGAIGPRLRDLAEQRPFSAGEIAAVMREFSLLHAELVRRLIDGEREPCDLVCVHGQTVFHQPPVSWQLMQPWPMWERLRVPIVFDLRQADLALGGQGAPLTPIADWVLFAEREDPRTIMNLGGFCNITRLSPRKADATSVPRLHGLDVCACNQVLDSIARRGLHEPFDADGAWAMRGQVNITQMMRLIDALKAQRGQGRSLGTGDELHEVLGSLAGMNPRNLARTACEAIAHVAAEVCLGEVFVAGGGSRNQALMQALRQRLPIGVRTTADLGVPIEYREAACWAVLGALCQDRVPIGVPTVTGVREPAPIAGTWIL